MRALAADAQRDIELGAKLATLLALGYRHSEITELRGIDSPEFVAAKGDGQAAVARMRENQ